MANASIRLLHIVVKEFIHFYVIEITHIAENLRYRKIVANTNMCMKKRSAIPVSEITIRNPDEWDSIHHEEDYGKPCVYHFVANRSMCMEK